MSRFVAVMLIVSGALWSAAAQAQSYKLTVVGDSDPSGKAIAAGIDRALKASFPGSAASYEQRTGAAAVIEAIQKNPKAVGIVDVVSAKLAVSGTAPFKAPAADVVALGALHDKVPFLAIITKDFLQKNPGVNFDEIFRRKLPIRLGLAETGTVDLVIELAALSAVKADSASIKGAGGSVSYGKKEDLFGQIKAKKLDMMIVMQSLGDPVAVELFKGNQVRLSSPSDPTIIELTAKLGMTRILIPGDVYPFQGPVHTPADGVMMIVNRKMPEKDAYDLAKALAVNLKELQSSGNLTKDLTGAALAGNRAGALHPGAEKYYREAGLIK